MALRAGAEWWRPAAAIGSGRAWTAAAPSKEDDVPFVALLVFIFVLLLAPQTFVPALARMRIALLTGVFALAAYCWSRFASGRPLTRDTREVRLVGALLAWAVITLPLSVSPGGSVRFLFNSWLMSLIVFWLLGNTVTTLVRLRTVAWAVSLMAAPLAATGVWNFLSHRELAGRISGYEAALTANPNDLALMLNLILPLTIALFLVSRRFAVRGLLAGLIALDASAIVVTFSRAGFLTLAATFVLYLRTLQGWQRWKWTFVTLLVAAAAVPLLPKGYLERLDTMKDVNADTTGSAQERLWLTHNALAFVLSHPLVGAGLGMNNLVASAPDESNYRPARSLYVHNVYLEYAVDLGWLGVGLFLLLLMTCLGTAARVLKRSAGLPASLELSALAGAIRIMLVAFGVAAFFYPVAYQFYFYYVAALAIAVGGVYEAEVRAAGSPLIR